MSEDIDSNIQQIKELLSNKNALKSMLGGTPKNDVKSDEENPPNPEAPNNSGSLFDADSINMLMKFKSLIDKTNKGDDPREKLLVALKPYLNEKRKDKVGNCLKILKVTNMLDTFKNMEGSDKNEQ